MTTIDTITSDQIEQLRNEAAEAGDLARVALCDEALDEIRQNTAGGFAGTANLRECVSVIRDAEGRRGVHVGDRIEAGDPESDDYDTGYVREIVGSQAMVDWDSGVATLAGLAGLRLVDGAAVRS